MSGRGFHITLLYAKVPQSLSMIYVCLPSPRILPFGVDRAPERAPGLVEQVVNASPVFVGDAALFGLAVAYLHGLGAQARVLHQSVGRDAVDFGGEVGQRAVEVAGGVARALAVDDPPFEFKARGALRVEARVGDFADRAVEAGEVREGALVVGARASVLEDEGGARRLVGDGVRAPERQAVLRAQKLRHLREEAHALAAVVGAPHRRLQARDLVGVEVAQRRAARRVKVVGDPDEQYEYDGGCDCEGAPQTPR